MPRGNLQKFGMLPSLEILPFLSCGFEQATGLTFSARSSYGSIAREMLVGDLVGGILPWEIFAAEVFAMTGQRDRWVAAFFSKPCPTELVLRPDIYKAMCGAATGGTTRKALSRLQIGIENRSSLTRYEFTEWLNILMLSPRPEVVFKFLPMDQRLEGMPANALDGFIARSPWGVIAEESGLGILVREFSKEAVSQRLVVVCRGNADACGAICDPEIIASLSKARQDLRTDVGIEDAARRMKACGKPHLRAGTLAKAAQLYRSHGISEDVVADIPTLTAELKSLYSRAMLPPQIAPSERTAMLLVPR